MSVQLARRVRTDVLDRIMDAHAHNRDQAATLVRLDTREIDSTIERVRALRDVPVPGRPGVFIIAGRQIDELEQDVWTLVESNDREGKLERKAAGASEGVNAALYTSAGRMRLDHRQLANALRPVLAVLGDRPLRGRRTAITVEEKVLAQIAWRSLACQIPAETLLSRSIAHELGEGHTETLRSLLDQLAERGSRR